MIVNEPNNFPVSFVNEILIFQFNFLTADISLQIINRSTVTACTKYCDTRVLVRNSLT